MQYLVVCLVAVVLVAEQMLAVLAKNVTMMPFDSPVSVGDYGHTINTSVTASRSTC